MKRKLPIILSCTVVLVLAVLLTACETATLMASKAESEISAEESIDMLEDVAALTESESKITPQTSSQPEASKPTEAVIDTVKQLIVQDELITANFAERKQPANPNFHVVNVYKNENEDILEYDSVTGQFVYMERQRLPFPNREGEKITEEKAIEIAKEFIKTHCYLDLSRYTLVRCKYYDNCQSYDIYYSWLYSGYTTGDAILVSVRENGKINYFSSSPYIFEGVKMKPIDEQVLLKQLDEQVRKHRSNLISYTVKDQGIGVDFDNEMVMGYDVIIKFEAPPEKKDTSNKEGAESTANEESPKVVTEGVAFQIKI